MALANFPLAHCPSFAEATPDGQIGIFFLQTEERDPCHAKLNLVPS
ncbi:hypothetical protein SYN63AY4M2_09290 [Synechococcus sp. 63AY4M2]|nr:hypothetical protein [Synechococcus sp. 65AY640]PIK84811.1 hypothetical protein SYN65AY6A5_12945 [Synechococcus sp. 65AY6A5]PIK87477.1 hypothetical protein SYN63AY4M2_09290 [Synechococcus sp. 63AY4M2]PIK96490.1 hypothetical protein SYN60AY4M2_09910 [Synechococcus sp. 60AY4M2]PIL02468.1 hypothetical protein SYN65AY640_06745 [Synechococcus sp. 65AY640]